MPNLQVPHYLLRLSRTEAPSLHRHYPASPVLRASPPPQGARPIRHRSSVDRPRPRPAASRVACAFPVYGLSPLPRHRHWWLYLAHPSSDVSLPRKGRRVGLCNVNFEACSAFTRVTARTLALPPVRGTLTRRLQTFRHLHACSCCFRLERLPGGACTRWKAPPFHGAHPLPTFREEDADIEADHGERADVSAVATRRRVTPPATALAHRDVQGVAAVNRPRCALGSSVPRTACAGP